VLPALAGASPRQLGLLLRCYREVDEQRGVGEVREMLARTGGDLFEATAAVVDEPDPAGTHLGTLDLSAPTRATLVLDRPERADLAGPEPDLLVVFAAVARLMLERAQERDRAEHARRWLSASSDVTRELLAGDSTGGTAGTDTLSLIVRAVHDLARAEFVAVMLRAGERHLRTAVTSGGDGTVYADEMVDPADVPAGAAVLAGRPGRYPTFEETVSPDWPNHYGIGPVMLAPLATPGAVHGVLCIGRRLAEPEFTDADLDLATNFAGHVSLALDLIDSQRAASRATVLAERNRIALELHDTVIQRLFAVGIGLEKLCADVGDADQSGALRTYVADLDTTIEQIRETIFG
jgi:signal transduction histidine kinase